MSRLVLYCLASMLSFAGGSGLAHAYDFRVDPNAARRTEISFAFSQGTLGALKAGGDSRLAGDKPSLPQEYASAMTWYRVALTDGYAQPPMVASPWARDEQLPEPLHWAWIADNGDLVTRAGRGVFRMSFADNRSNWFREVDCRLLSWPGGNSDAPMTCSDGKERIMQIPGDGVVLVDGVQYMRVFDSDETTLPPEEVISLDEATAAAIAGQPIPGIAAATTAPQAVDLVLPDKAPIPRSR